jgi:hypothetical protein
MKMKKKKHSTKVSQICSNTGNYKQHFYTSFGPDVFKKKSIQNTGCTNSFIRKQNLDPYKKGEKKIFIMRHEIF